MTDPLIQNYFQIHSTSSYKWSTNFHEVPPKTCGITTPHNPQHWELQHHGKVASLELQHGMICSKEIELQQAGFVVCLELQHPYFILQLRT